MSVLLPLAGLAGLAALGVGGWYGCKRTRRSRAKARLRREVLALAARQMGALEDLRVLGVGNVGAVLDCRLGEGWRQQLGVRWEGPLPVPERAAVKLARFRKGAGERLEVLADLAGRIATAMQSGNPPAMCPFLALGAVKDSETGTEYVAEVMPLAGGRGLDAVLRADGLDPLRAVPELCRVLRTAVWMEAEGFYSRNLDAENVIVQPDGSWLRIDFDNATRRTEFPPLRMCRLARLTAQVLSAFPGRHDTAEIRAILRRLKVTEYTLQGVEISRDRVPAGAVEVIASPAELLEVLAVLKYDAPGSDRRSAQPQTAQKSQE